jgi:hypothetical protein
MLIGVHKQFVPDVLDGRKRQSFRAYGKKKRLYRVGDDLQFYTGAYLPGVRKKLGDSVCTEAIDSRVENHIDHWRTDSQWTCVSRYGYWLVVIGGKVLNLFEADAAAVADGFENLMGFMQYIAPLKRSGPKKDKNIFRGQLIKWSDIKVDIGAMAWMER